MTKVVYLVGGPMQGQIVELPVNSTTFRIARPPEPKEYLNKRDGVDIYDVLVIGCYVSNVKLPKHIPGDELFLWGGWAS